MDQKAIDAAKRTLKVATRRLEKSKKQVEVHQEDYNYAYMDWQKLVATDVMEQFELAEAPKLPSIALPPQFEIAPIGDDRSPEAAQ